MGKTYIEPFRLSTQIFKDSRGDFSPIVLKEQLPDFNIVQVNTVATLEPLTFRGMHWQEPPYAQAKLIRCVFGKIIDFAIDIRQGSPYYGQAVGFVLSDKNDWVYIPEGFAHGYITLPHNLSGTFPTIVEYLVNNEYNKESERGIKYTQEIRDIIKMELPEGCLWGVIKGNERDQNWPTLDEIETSFRYEPEEQ